jgi:hypothetical protein
MEPQFLGRSLSREEGLAKAYKYFNEDSPIEAAAMFCAYNDKENDLQITTDSEIKAMANQFQEMLTTYALVDLIKKGLVLPSLNEDNVLVFTLNK